VVPILKAMNTKELLEEILGDIQRHGRSIEELVYCDRQSIPLDEAEYRALQLISSIALAKKLKEP